MSQARIGAVVSMMTALCVFPSLAYAQATRTWVSGVGDDANPCSRTAPCKTFPGAISKTAASGEIDVLDPGGFGAVTITKSIVIDGSSALAGILVSGTNGINVVAGTNDVVILRNLDINGVGTGLSGIHITGAGDVRVENCKIYGFNLGIEDDRTSGHLAVSNTVVSNNRQTGILASPGAGGTLNVSLDHVQMHSNANAGFAGSGAVRALVVQSLATSNAYGFYAEGGAVLDLTDSVASGNTGIGVMSYTGATIRLSNTSVTSNSTGLWAGAGASLLSYGTNRVAGNLVNGSPTGTLAGQ
jgi:Right handed beta helix region